MSTTTDKTHSLSSRGGISQPVLLLERIGGDTGCQFLMATFFDEIGKQDSLAPFFKHISLSALAAHLVKLFRVLFGPEEEKPDKTDFYDYMLATHTRLFRDIGLDETHFDDFAGCLVRALQLMELEEDLKNEILAIFVPLRVIFEYGAKVAAHEKTLTPKQVSMLPMASSKTVGVSDGVTRALPDPAHVEIPEWLPLFLGKNSKESAVRAWTCALINVYGVGGDKAVADTFMDMPYMNHHVYLVAFLQLAFQPVIAKNKHLIQIVKYPRGPQSPPLCRSLFVRMNSLFERVCEDMLLDSSLNRKTMKKLEAFKAHFPSVRLTTVKGLDTPHILRKLAQVQLALPEGFTQSEVGVGQQQLHRNDNSKNRINHDNKTRNKHISIRGDAGRACSGKTSGSMRSGSDGGSEKIPSGRRRDLPSANPQSVSSKSGTRNNTNGSVSTSTSSANVTGSSNVSSKSSKRVWRKMFGWIKV